jgi:hypothetical protein
VRSAYGDWLAPPSWKRIEQPVVVRQDGIDTPIDTTSRLLFTRAAPPLFDAMQNARQRPEMYHRATVAGTIASMRSLFNEVFGEVFGNIPGNLCTQDRQPGQITADRRTLSTRLQYF